MALETFAAAPAEEPQAKAPAMLAPRDARRMLPAMDGPAAPPPAAVRRLRSAGTTGWAWIEVDAALERDLARWIAERDVAGSQVLKAGSVFRLGELVIKFLPAPIGPIQRRRVPPAVRAARQHFALEPLQTPRPLIALKAETPNGRVDLLVSEFVEGRPLDAVWATEARAREALPAVLAELRRRRIVHGDLHPGNLLWTGSHWVLLDLEAVRGGLHRIFAPRRASLSQWARLLILTGDEAGLREAHARWLQLLGAGAEERRWARVLDTAQRQRAVRAAGFPDRWRRSASRRSGSGEGLA